MASYFGDFQPHELDLVLSIPYRAGAWMSHADNVEITSRDNMREEIALERILNRIHDQAGGDSFVRSVLHEIIVHKADWDGWDILSSSFLDDVTKALRLIDNRLPNPEGLQYRKCIFHIAKTVAMAANEGFEEHFAPVSKSGLWGKLTDWVAAKSSEGIPANISPKEQGALAQLLQRLKT